MPNTPNKPIAKPKPATAKPLPNKVNLAVTHAQPGKRAQAATILPQTGERAVNSATWGVIGLTVVWGILGLIGIKRKSH